MIPEQKQAIQQHIQAIAEILYEETPEEELKTLAGIEQAVRTQMQTHIMPEVGVFLSQKLQEQQMDVLAASKAFSES